VASISEKNGVGGVGGLINIREGLLISTNVVRVAKVGDIIDVLPDRKQFTEGEPYAGSIRVQLLDGTGWTSLQASDGEKLLDLVGPTPGAGEAGNGGKDLKESLVLASRFSLITHLNEQFVQCLELCDYDNKSSYIGAMIRKHAGTFILSCVKKEIIAQALERTKRDEKKYPVRLAFRPSRALKDEHMEQKEVDLEGRWSMFGQLFQCIHSKEDSSLRTSSDFFEVLLGKFGAGIDGGGLYRAHYTEMIEELHCAESSPVLPLFVRYNPRAEQDSFLINPCITSSSHLDMLAFFGKLCGIAMRSKNFYDLNFNPFVWKVSVEFECSTLIILNIHTYTLTNTQIPTHSFSPRRM